MHELGVRMYRQRIHRDHPQATRREIDGMITTWLAACACPQLLFASSGIENEVVANADRLEVLPRWMPPGKRSSSYRHAGSTEDRMSSPTWRPL
jgi:Rv0078B-related antitoxin